MKRKLGAHVGEFAKWFAVLAVADVAVGAAWAELRGRNVATSVTGVFFLTGGVIFVGAAASGGGTRAGARGRVGSKPAAFPFVAVFLGLALIGVAVLILVV
jgi:hypothetical protein